MAYLREAELSAFKTRPTRRKLEQHFLEIKFPPSINDLIASSRRVIQVLNPAHQPHHPVKYKLRLHNPARSPINRSSTYGYQRNTPVYPGKADSPPGSNKALTSHSTITTLNQDSHGRFSGMDLTRCPYQTLITSISGGCDSELLAKYSSNEWIPDQYYSILQKKRISLSLHITTTIIIIIIIIINTNHCNKVKPCRLRLAKTPDIKL
ncbi:hypothetical protein YC2023_071363 [Brassica napus]